MAKLESKGDAPCERVNGVTTSQCWEFKEADKSIEKQNEQVARLIVALGSAKSGKLAILKAVAERLGIVDEDEMHKMMEGTSDTKLQVPHELRPALETIGLGRSLAPINLFEILEQEQILNIETWQDLEFEVALDSGAVVHVCSLDDTPGYVIEESLGSKRKQEFLMADGGTKPNLGQKTLNLDDDGNELKAIFQIAAVTRPLMSVGRICDEGHNVTFDSVMAIIRTKDGDEICRFHREKGGLYIAKMKLRSPSTPASFPRQE